MLVMDDLKILSDDMKNRFLFPRWMKKDEENHSQCGIEGRRTVIGDDNTRKVR